MTKKLALLLLMVALLPAATTFADGNYPTETPVPPPATATNPPPTATPIPLPSNTAPPVAPTSDINAALAPPPPTPVTSGLSTLNRILLFCLASTTVFVAGLIAYGIYRRIQEENR